MTSRPALRRILPFLCLLAVLVMGCDGTETVTPLTTSPTTPDATTTPDSQTTPVAADAGTVKALQLEAEDFGCDPNGFANVGADKPLTGVVVTAGKFDLFTDEEEPEDSLDGYFVADADGGDWSGIQIAVARDDGTDFQPGDLLDATGELVEFYCNTQLKLTSYTVTGTTDAPTGTLVDPADVATEAHEGMLVTVENVQIEAQQSAGVYTMTGGFTAAYGFPFFFSLDQGVTYNLTGVIRYAYGEYQLLARSEADVVVVGDGPDPGGETNTTIEAVQSSDASTTCDNPGFDNVGSGLVLEGVIITERFDVGSTLHGYYLTDGSLNPYSGVLMVVATTANSGFGPSDHVRATGEHLEYYCLTEFKASDVEIIGQESLPGAVIMDIATLAAEAESWEGVLVEVHDVEVTSTDNFEAYGEVELENGIILDDNVIGQGALPGWDVGDVLEVVRGAISYSYGAYRINPRDMGDFYTIEVPTPDPDAGGSDGGSTDDDASSGASDDIGPEADGG